LKTLILLDPGALGISKKERPLYFLFLFFFVALYMPGISWLYNVAMWFLFVYSFVFNSITEKWRLLKERPEILVMMLFLVLNAVSSILSVNQKEGISFLGLRISLFIIPFAIGSIYIKPYLKERIVFGFAVVTTFAAFGCLIWGTYRASKNQDWSLLYNDNLSYIINFQSIYFAMLITLAIFSFTYLLTKKSKLINISFLLPALFILLIVHFLLASRMAILILYSAIFIYAVVHIVLKKKWLEGITLIMGIFIAGFLLVNFFPKTINRFKELSYTKFDYNSTAKESHFNVALQADQWNGANLRIAVWQCAWTVIKEHIVFGTGLGDKMDVLKKEYAKKGFAFGIQTKRNTHNNYLDIWLSLGITGLLIFLAGFIAYPISKCYRTSDWFGAIITISFAVALLAETYMDRTMGNTLLAFFAAFISSYKKPSCEPDH
jgi:O-antigen ligase